MEKEKRMYALVTGGSRGIGRAVCIRLAQMGFRVLVNCVSRVSEAEETLRLIREAGSDGKILQFDVSDRAQTAKILDAWKDNHPEDYIQVLVNNAGIRRDNILALMPAEDWDKVLEIALGGFYNVTQPLLQPMMFHKWGRIITLASVSGLKGMPGQANYSAAKGGVIAATKALAQEVAYPYGHDGRFERSGVGKRHSGSPFWNSRRSGGFGRLSGISRSRIHYR